VFGPKKPESILYGFSAFPLIPEGCGSEVAKINPDSKKVFCIFKTL
jgi:hypothetical protein